MEKNTGLSHIERELKELKSQFNLKNITQSED